MTNLAAAATTLLLSLSMIRLSTGADRPELTVQAKVSDQAKKAGALEWSATDGRLYRPFANEAAGTLFFFILHDCPRANEYAPEIGRIVAKCQSRGIQCFIVYPERDLSREAAAKHAKEFRYPCPALLDPDLRLARIAGAQVSPEAALFRRGPELVYRGRIDDRFSVRGKPRVEATEHDLADAVESLLAGKTIARAVVPATGCYLDLKP